MSSVKFMELETNATLRALEKKISAVLAKECPGMSVRLFQDQAGKIGYSVQVVASMGSKKALDLVHRLVCDMTGYKRGRPPSEPTHQVKCRIPESTDRRLLAESRKRKTTPSTLVKEWLVKHVG
jgi:hypothetical protein